MKQFRALVCGRSSNNQLSLPLLAAYLDEHTLPAEIGELTLPNLVDREYIAKDPEHPAYYFCLLGTAARSRSKGQEEEGAYGA